MPTTWYFDASGTEQTPVLVLSAVGASNRVWDDFNREWISALAILGIDEWHTADYVRERGNIPSAILNVIGRLTGKEFNVFSFAVDTEAARRLRLDHPTDVPRIDNMLGHLCFGKVGVAAEDADTADRLLLLFDEGEPFLKHLRSAWLKARKGMRRSDTGWPVQITDMRFAASNEHAGLQVADLVSWTIRRRYLIGDRLAEHYAAPVMVLFALLGQLRGGFFDEEALRAHYVAKKPLEMSHSYTF